jgi:hypothetical protein
MLGRFLLSLWNWLKYFMTRNLFVSVTNLLKRTINIDNLFLYLGTPDCHIIYYSFF